MFRSSKKVCTIRIFGDDYLEERESGSRESGKRMGVRCSLTCRRSNPLPRDTQFGMTENIDLM